jgi:hypothetical protein
LFKSTIYLLIPATLGIWERERGIKWESWSQHAYSCHWRYYCSVVTEGRGHLSSYVRTSHIVETQAGWKRRYTMRYGRSSWTFSAACGVGCRAPSLSYPETSDYQPLSSLSWSKDWLFPLSGAVCFEHLRCIETDCCGREKHTSYESIKVRVGGQSSEP